MHTKFRYDIIFYFHLFIVFVVIVCFQFRLWLTFVDSQGIDCIVFNRPGQLFDGTFASEHATWIVCATIDVHVWEIFPNRWHRCATLHQCNRWHLQWLLLRHRRWVIYYRKMNFNYSLYHCWDKGNIYCL